jgi:hypothetical protein
VEELPCSFRRGWDSFPNLDLQRTLDQIILSHEGHDPTSNIISWNKPLPPTSFSIFYNPEALGAYLTQRVTTGVDQSMQSTTCNGLNLDYLNELSIIFNSEKSSHLQAWGHFFSLYHLGFEVLRPSTLSCFLAYFFVWSDSSIDDGRSLVSSIPSSLSFVFCDILHRIPQRMIPALARWMLHKQGKPSRDQAKLIMQRILTSLHDLIALRFKESTDQVDIGVVYATKTMALFCT